MVPERPVSGKPIGLFMVISIFVFFTVVIAGGILYFYDSSLKGNIAKMQNDLNLAKDRFEPSKIVQLQTLDKRLKASNEILSKHVAISPIFEALQDMTIKTIGYTKFSYDSGEGSKDSKIVVNMSGVATGYLSVALQSDIFSKNKNFIDPVFYNLSLDDKGNVLFDLKFSVDPSFINYKKMVEAGGTVNTSLPPISTGTTN